MIARAARGVRELARAWVALWDRREPPTALALVRIALGLVILYDLLTAWRLGLVEALWAPPPDGFATGTVGHPPWSVRWFGAGPELARGLWLVATVAGAAIATGTATRVACVVFALTSAQLSYIAPDADRGIDILLRVVALVLALSGANARWSVDAWIRRWIGRPMPAEIPSWPRLLLFAQLIWVYFSGGHNKGGAEWGPMGEFAALANVLSDPHFARFDAGWVPSVYPLTQLATAATMAFELGAPLMLLLVWFDATRDRPGRIRRWCNRLRLRWVWIALGASFHLGIAITMQLGIFPWGMLALYPVLLRPDEVARLGAWVRRRGRRPRAPAT